MNHWMSGQGHLSWYVRAWLPPALLLHYFLSWTIGWVGRAIPHGTCLNATCITSALLSFLNEPLDEWAGPFLMVRAWMPPALLLHYFLSWMDHWMSGRGHWCYENVLEKKVESALSTLSIDTFW
jgi:hypothetical protein